MRPSSADRGGDYDDADYEEEEEEQDYIAG